MKNLYLVATLALLTFAAFVKATTIEGFTPAGQYQTVGVTPQGQLDVSVGSGVVHVIIDSGANHFVTASSATLVFTGSGTLTANLITLVYPADALRAQGTVCNDDTTGLVWYVGSITASSTTWKLFPPGCLSPDGPESFVGALYASSTATVQTSYWYTRRN